MPRRLGLIAIIAALLMLAACQTADPNGNGNGTAPPLGQADFEAAAESIGASGEVVVTDLMSDPVVLAMGSLPPLFSATPAEELVGLAAAIAPLETGALPRGILEFNPDTDTWDEVDSALGLELRWPFLDLDDVERDAVLVIDWGTTATVEDRNGRSIEVPTDDMSVTLTVDGDTVAAFDAGISWYAGPGCPDGVAEPTSVRVDGSMGAVATISLNDVSITLLDTSLATSGEIVAASGDESIGVAWNVTINCSIVRVDCFIDDIEEVDSGSVSVTLFGESAGSRTSVGLNVDFDTIVLDPEDGELVSVDLDGSIDINGVSAVTFSGTLDDENENGIPGENLVLVFADGETMTFEALLEEAFHATTSAVSRLLSLGR